MAPGLRSRGRRRRTGRVLAPHVRPDRQRRLEPGAELHQLAAFPPVGKPPPSRGGRKADLGRCAGPGRAAGPPARRAPGRGPRLHGFYRRLSAGQRPGLGRPLAVGRRPRPGRKPPLPRPGVPGPVRLLRPSPRRGGPAARLQGARRGPAAAVRVRPLRLLGDRHDAAGSHLVLRPGGLDAGGAGRLGGGPGAPGPGPRPARADRGARLGRGGLPGGPPGGSLAPGPAEPAGTPGRPPAAGRLPLGHPLRRPRGLGPAHRDLRSHGRLGRGLRLLPRLAPAEGRVRGRPEPPRPGGRLGRHPPGLGRGCGADRRVPPAASGRHRRGAGDTPAGGRGIVPAGRAAAFPQESRGGRLLRDPARQHQHLPPDPDRSPRPADGRRAPGSAGAQARHLRLHRRQPPAGLPGSLQPEGRLHSRHRLFRRGLPGLAARLHLLRSHRALRARHLGRSQAPAQAVRPAVLAHELARAPRERGGLPEPRRGRPHPLRAARALPGPDPPGRPAPPLPAHGLPAPGGALLPTGPAGAWPRALLHADAGPPCLGHRPGRAELRGRESHPRLQPSLRQPRRPPRRLLRPLHRGPQEDRPL